MKIENLIEENYEKLNDNDIYIWNYILHHKKECRTMSIQELASKCNVSHTTILRFTHKLGLEGYSELKIHLKWEEKGENQFDPKEIDNTCKDIIMTMEELKNRDFNEMFRTIDNADKIYIYGSGAVQKDAAKELKRNMIFSNKLVYVLEGKEETNIILEALTNKDVFFLLSFSGNNSFVNNFALKLKAKGIAIISINLVGNNELASISNFNIPFYSHSIVIKRKDFKYWTTSQFFVICELLVLKYIQYSMS